MIVKERISGILFFLFWFHKFALHHWPFLTENKSNKMWIQICKDMKIKYLANDDKERDGRDSFPHFIKFDNEFIEPNRATRWVGFWFSTDHNYISLHASCPMASCDWFGFLFHFHAWKATTRKYWLSNLIWIIQWCGIRVNDGDNKDIDDLGMERQPWVFHKIVPRPSLKALFNHVFSFKKSELHGPTCYQYFW